MRWLLQRIREAKTEDIQDILQAVLERYRELYPDWDISILSLDKREDRNEQLERTVALLEKMKE